MFEEKSNAKGFSFDSFLGLDERKGNASLDSSASALQGYILQQTGVLERMPGILPAYTLPTGAEILNIHQTFDSNKNLIIQATDGVYIIPEPEFFGYTQTFSLTNFNIFSEDDTMAFAHIVCADTVDQAAIGTAYPGTKYKLTSIVAQKNPDGTAAAFATIASDTITLLEGIYRVRGYATVSLVSGTRIGKTFLYNSTDTKAAWSGLINEYSDGPTQGPANTNFIHTFDGYIDITADGPDGVGPKDYQIRQVDAGSGAGSMLGGKYNLAGGDLQIFAQLIINKLQ